MRLVKIHILFLADISRSVTMSSLSSSTFNILQLDDVRLSSFKIEPHDAGMCALRSFEFDWNAIGSM